MDQLFTEYGLPGAIIGVLLTAIGFLYRQNSQKDKFINELQEKRITDAKDTNEKLIQPLAEVTRLTQNSYDILINNNNKRRD